MADSWLSQIRSNPHLKDPEPQAAMTTIHDVVVERLSPLDAARQISSTYEPALRQGHSGLWSLWTIINSAITNLGGDTDILQRLAQMLIQLSRLPNIVDDSGRPLKSPSGRKIWQELPDFSFYFFEEAIAHVLIENIESSRHGATVDGAAKRLMNANTFAALYLCELDPGGPTNEFSSMRKVAREHFMYTLEIPFDTPERVRRAEIYIAPAAAWITIAGPNLYHYSKSNTDYEGEDVSPWWIGGTYGGMVMWEKRDGFSIERWTFWRDRFQEFSQLQSASEEARKQAGEATQTILAIEKADKE